MDLFKIFSEIEKIDDEVYERFDTRRRAFKHITGLGKTITAATLPAVLGTMFNKAYGQTTLDQVIVDTLNLALQLEYLEFHYYNTALSRTGLIPATEVPAITIIRDDELGHKNAIQKILGTRAIADPGADAFDFSAGGRVGGDPLNNTALFFGTAQAFVDTGIRAYKGGAPKLMGNKTILTAALNIHSVEARHSSHFRSFRRGGPGVVGEVAGGTGNLKPKSWVSLRENGGPAPGADPNTKLTAPVYGPGASTEFPAEDNVVQATFNTQTQTTFPAIAGVTIGDPEKRAAASEAFDEPLDDVTVKTIARNFLSAKGRSLNLFA